MRKRYTERTLKKLFALSGNMCAFNEGDYKCNQNIVDEDGTMIGEICHIEAAEPDGRRYNPNQTDDDKRSFDNLMLLCGVHHKITNNVEKYPVEKLKKMKSEHESRFLNNKFQVSKDVLRKAIEKFTTTTHLNIGKGISQFNPVIGTQNIIYVELERKPKSGKTDVNKYVHGRDTVHAESQIGVSKLGLDNLLEQTTQQIFISGQNLYFLTRDENKEKYKRSIFTALKKNKRIQIMICDVKEDYAVKTWGEMVGDETKYREHLVHSTKTFSQWTKQARDEGLKGLEIKRVVLVPLSITFVDPHKASSRLVFTTVIYEPKSEWRPVYLVFKTEQPYIFNYYWASYKEVFSDRQRAIDIV